MATTPIYRDQNFYVPQFEIKLRGQSLSQAVIRDVIDVSYRESLERLDSVEFTLHDWDPVQRIPRYSSPYDSDGNERTMEDGSPVPNFDPGAQIELRLGYRGSGDLQLMMTGEVVSLTPTFPASGTPTLRVRALSLLCTLQRSQEVRAFEDLTDSQIAQEIGDDLGIEVEIPRGQSQQEETNEYVLVNNEYPIIFLMGRARRLGYDLYVKIPEDDGEPVLFFGSTPTAQVTYELTWGQSLIQFMPTLKTKGQVSRVVVRGWNPLAEGEDRVVEGVATLQDLDPELPDQRLLQAIDAALAETHEVVVDDAPLTQEEADSRALGILAGNWRQLITGRGRTVGLPSLRAGRTVVINGLGPRFSGRYVLTETTHTLNNSGYITEFNARLEGPA